MKYETQHEAINGIVGAYVNDIDVDLVQNYRRIFPFSYDNDEDVLYQVVGTLYQQNQNAFEKAEVHRIFLSQRLTREEATKCLRPQVVEALRNLWFDGKNYQRISQGRTCGCPLTRATCRKYLRELGLSGRRRSAGGLSETSTAMSILRHNS